MTVPVARRERKKAQTRKLLVDVALHLIAERGIYGTRIEDITERSDLGKGAFYNYFPSKNALVASLVGEGVALLCADFLTGLADDSGAGGAARVAAVVRGHDEFFTKHPVFVLIFHQARGIAKVDAPGGDLENVFVAYLQRIGDLLLSPHDRARTSDLEKMDLAAVILGSIAGYRSFRMAAGLGLESDALTRVLTSGAAAVATTARPLL